MTDGGLIEWARSMADESVGRWVSLIHPEFGNAQGECFGMRYAGLDRAGIPDFQVAVLGWNDNIIVRLLESRLRFHDSELEAIERWATQWDTGNLI